MISKKHFYTALILILFWAMGFWFFNVGSIIHVTFVFIFIMLISCYQKPIKIHRNHRMISNPTNLQVSEKIN